MVDIVCSPEQNLRLFQAVDTDNSNSVEQEELMHLLYVPYAPPGRGVAIAYTHPHATASSVSSRCLLESPGNAGDVSSCHES